MITEAINILAKREDLYNCLLKAELFQVLERNYRTLKLAELIIDKKNGTWGEDFLKDGYKVKVLRSQDIRHGFINFEKAEVRYVSRIELEKNQLEEGDILVIKSNGSEDLVGKSQIFYSNQLDTVIPSNFLMKIRPNQDLIIPNYLDLFLKSPQALKWRVDKQSTTTGLRNLDTDGFLSVDVPIPTLEEQEIIVNNYNSFFEGDFSCSTVFDISRIQKFKNLCYILNSFSNEFDQQQAYLQLLRQTILQEAVQGKLTNQDPRDEPATVLLKRIKTEKEKLVKAGKLKKEKELPPITDDEIPFELPEGWVWCRLKDLGFITGGGTPSTSNNAYWGGDIPWITPKDMKAEFLSDAEDKVSIEGVNNSSAKLIPANSILVVGRSGILKRTLPVCINTVECVVNQDLKVIVPYLYGMSRFIQIMLQGNEDFILQNLVKYGMTVHSLIYQEFEVQPFPLPPLHEQERIVVKVQQLQQQLRQLEEQVQQSRHYAQQLLQAVLREAFEAKNVKEYKVNGEVSLAAEE